MRRVLFAFTVLAVASISVAEVPIVTVNVNIGTNVVDDAKAAERAAAEKAAAEKAAAEAAAARAARMAAARKRSHVVVKQLIADLKPVPGKEYLLGRTEVTVEQWHAVMKPDIPFVGEANLAFRLPTVKEWRHACLAGAKGKWGFVAPKKVGKLEAMGWHAGNSGNRKSAVAKKMPNAWGFVDMHGNVYEWCADTCPEYGGDYRVRAGGSFRSMPEQCSASFPSSANRQFSRYDDQGCRLLAERH